MTTTDGSDGGAGGCVEKTYAGGYRYEVELKDKVNWRWTDGSTTNLVYTWSILPRTLTPLALPQGLVYAGTNAVAITDNFNNTTDSVTNGVFYVRATIRPADNWAGAVRSKRFLIYKSFEELYTDFVDIEFPSYQGEGKDNAVVLIKISENIFKGFSYDRCDGGDKLAFMNFTEGLPNSPLSFEVDTWKDKNGESLVWVKIPRLESREGYAKTKIRMYWHLREGMEAPGLSPEDVWLDYAGVWHFTKEIGTNFIFPVWVSQEGVLKNYWRRAPSISKISWKNTDPPATVDVGTVAIGTPFYVVKRLFSEGLYLTNALPVEPGKYTINFYVAEEGRILPANDDAMDDCGELAVTNQAQKGATKVSGKSGRIRIRGPPSLITWHFLTLHPRS